MLRYSGLVLFFLSFCFCFTTVLFAEDPVEATGGSTEIIAQLDQMRTGLEDGLQSGDVDKLISLAHPDLVVTWQNGEVSRGVDQVRQFLERMMVGPDSVVKNITMQPIKVEDRIGFESDFISLGSLQEEYHLREGDLVFPLNSRFSAWTVREGNEYLLRGLHFSANVFDNPIQDLMVKKATIQSGLIGLLVGAGLVLLLVVVSRKRKSEA